MTRSARDAVELTWKLLYGTRWNYMIVNRFGSALTKNKQLGVTTDTRIEREKEKQVQT
jgi:hypothetical protein